MQKTISFGKIIDNLAEKLIQGYIVDLNKVYNSEFDKQIIKIGIIE